MGRGFNCGKLTLHVISLIRDDGEFMDSEISFLLDAFPQPTAILFDTGSEIILSAPEIETLLAHKDQVHVVSGTGTRLDEADKRRNCR